MKLSLDERGGKKNSCERLKEEKGGKKSIASGHAEILELQQQFGEEQTEGFHSTVPYRF